MIGGDVAHEGAGDFVVAHAAVQPAQEDDELHSDGDRRRGREKYGLRISFPRSVFRFRARCAQFSAVGRPGVVAEPAEAREALAEFFGDGRRQPGVHVFEAALPGVALGGSVQREQPLPTLARCAGVR
jgi:hypothetical protein